MSLNEKIEMLGISEEGFELYCQTFVKNWSQYRIKETESPGWYLVKSRTGRPVHLRREAIADHLYGKYWVSIFAPEVPRYLPFDIDQSPAQLQIYRAITYWANDLLTFRSSETGGLHAYVFLPPAFPIRWDKLLKITEIELRKMGIELAPGTCELPLNPKLSLRLPLGRQSCLVHPKTLLPLDLNLGDAINYISTHIRYYSIVDLFPWLKRRIHE